MRLDPNLGLPAHVRTNQGIGIEIMSLQIVRHHKLRPKINNYISFNMLKIY